MSVIKHTEETKRKMSEALKGHVAWNKGLHVSEETKKKISLSNMREKKKKNVEFAIMSLWLVHLGDHKNIVQGNVAIKKR